MTFLVRNVSIVMLLTALCIVGLASLLAGRTFYENMLNRVFEERMLMVESLGKVMARDSGEILATLPDVFAMLGRESEGVRTLRFVDSGTRRILASADITEVGRVIDRPLPTSALGSMQVSVTSIKDDEVVDLTFGTPLGLLWMTLDRSYFTSPAILFSVQTGMILFALLSILGILFYLIARRYFVRPLRLLKHAVVGVAPADGGVDKDDLGVLLESFASVARKVEETLARDKLVSQMKSDFISTTAHQLRTPLSGINWALGSLLSGEESLTANQKNLLTRALEKDKELIELVGTLLNAASIEEGKFGYHRESIQLQDEIKKAVESEQAHAQGEGITLSFTPPSGAIPAVFIDRERVSWVIRNLIENAIRYSNPGGAVVVSLSQDAKQLQVAVRDTGIGIPLKEQPYIFQKFFRADEAQKKQNEGSGLGLFIAKNIINYHGGRVWFESEEGKGTTFYFTLPLSRRHIVNA